MRITIDWDLCQGHAQCMGEVPEVFAVDGAGKLTLRDEFPPESLRARLTIAARYCPNPERHARLAPRLARFRDLYRRLRGA